MIKKLLMGCGCLTIILVIVCTGMGIFTYRKVHQIADTVSAGMVEINALNDRYPFTAPADSSIDEDRLKAYFAVRENSVKKLMGNPTIAKIVNAGGGQPDIGMLEMLRLITDIAGLSLDAFRESLNEQSMSPKEFNYLGRTMYRTIVRGAELGMNPMEKISSGLKKGLEQMNAELVKNGQGEHQIKFDELIGQFAHKGSVIPEENYDKVQAYEEILLKAPHVSFFELMVLGIMGGNAPAPAIQPLGRPALEGETVGTEPPTEPPTDLLPPAPAEDDSNAAAPPPPPPPPVAP